MTTETTMKIWLLKRTDDIDYDEYDSDVVAAIDEESARRLSNVGCYAGSTAEVIGTAQRGMEEGIILGSFNAG